MNDNTLLFSRFEYMGSTFNLPNLLMYIIVFQSFSKQILSRAETVTLCWYGTGDIEIRPCCFGCSALCAIARRPKLCGTYYSTNCIRAEGKKRKILLIYCITENENLQSAPCSPIKSNQTKSTYFISNCSIISNTCIKCLYPTTSCRLLASALAVLTTFLICRPFTFFSPRSCNSSRVRPALSVSV